MRWLRTAGRCLTRAFDWRTGLLAALFATGTLETLLGVHLSRVEVLQVDTPTMVAVAAVWASLTTWCLLRRRVTEGEALTQLTSVSAMLVLEGVLVPDPTWQWVCTTVLFVVPVAAVMFLRRSLLVVLTAGVVVGQVLVALSREQATPLALYSLTAVLLCSFAPVVVVSTLASALRAAQARAEHLARTDALTGLLNRHGMGEAAVDAVGGAARAGLALGVLVADIDRFKAVNDTWGHAVGDRVLAQTAGALRAGVRTGDLVIRLGGEEFAVIGAWDDVDLPAVAAERLRAAVEQLDSAGVPRVTISVGVAVLPEVGLGLGVGEAAAEVLARLVSEADDALYEAKRAGRNRVHRSSQPGAGAAPARVGAAESDSDLVRRGLPATAAGATTTT